jgi:Uma2 family endonuclease
LSDSTETYDRGAKFTAYRNIPTFQEYLLIAQDRIYIEHFYREAQESDRWIFTAYESTGIIKLISLALEITIKEIYNRALL